MSLNFFGYCLKPIYSMSFLVPFHVLSKLSNLRWFLLVACNLRLRFLVDICCSNLEVSTKGSLRCCSCYQASRYNILNMCVCVCV